jgi:predicted ATPase
MSHDDVALYFCSREGAEAKIEALDIDTYGEISNWPENLFGDEMTDIAARAMATVRRKRQQNN